MILKFRMQALVVLSIAMLVFVGCEKEEGLGGTSKIEGTLVVNNYNSDFSVLQSSQPAIDEDVFIIFGNNEVVGEKTTTNYNGKFEFPYLREGSYTIYYLSADSLNPQADKKEVLIQVTIGKGETKNLGSIVQFKSLDFDEGAASIKGKVRQINYWKQSIPTNPISKEDTIPAQELEVYLTYNDHAFYDERIRTQDDGTFEFKNLLKGKYRIFFYSKDIHGGEADVAVDTVLNITEWNQEVNVGDMFRNDF